MMFFLSLVGLLLISSSVFADDAARDVALGLQGLIEASKDPAALAQLMQDLQVSGLLSLLVSLPPVPK